MKLTLDQPHLAAAIAHAGQALPARPAVPVLAGLRLTAHSGGLTVAATDYDTSATDTAIGALVAEPGSALVSGRLLSDITRTLRGDITLTSTGTHLLLESARARFTLAQLPIDEYPKLPETAPAAGAVPAAVFAEAVAQIAVAAGRDDSLPVLTGVQLTTTADTITLAATDRYRFAVRTLPWTPTAGRGPHSILVPARTLAAAAKGVTAGFSGDVTLGIDDTGGLLSLTGRHRHTTTRALDGSLPNHAKLFPAADAIAHTLTAPTADLQAAIKRVALVADRNTPVRLTLADGQLTIEAGTADDAQARESLDATTTGAFITIAFNPGFLAETLGALTSDRAHLSLTHPTKPAVLRGADADDQALATLLMPVRLSS